MFPATQCARYPITIYALIAEIRTSALYRIPTCQMRAVAHRRMRYTHANVRDRLLLYPSRGPIQMRDIAYSEIRHFELGQTRAAAYYHMCDFQTYGAAFLPPRNPPCPPPRAISIGRLLHFRNFAPYTIGVRHQ